MTTPESTKACAFETTICSRCGGDGRYSYCQRFGDTCFKCRGAGRVLTARGAAAKAKLAELRSKRADEVRVGDVLWSDASPLDAGCWYRVDTVEVTDTSGWRSFVNGVELPVRSDLLTITGTPLDEAQARRGCRGVGGIPPESLVRVRQTAEQAEATLAAALAYQATLTKAGTPRKR